MSGLMIATGVILVLTILGLFLDRCLMDIYMAGARANMPSNNSYGNGAAPGYAIGIFIALIMAGCFLVALALAP